MKIYLAKFSSNPMNITANFTRAEKEIYNCAENGCDVIVFPSGCLIGAPLGVLSNAEWTYNLYNKKISELCKKAENLGIAVIADILDKNSRKFTPKIKTANSEYCFKTKISNYKCSAVQSSTQLFEDKTLIADNDIIFINWMESGVAGQKYLLIDALKKITAECSAIFVLNTAGSGYTTHPNFYMPIAGIVQNGKADIYYGFKEISSRPCVFKTDKPDCTCCNADFKNFSLSFPICYNQNPLIPSNVPTKLYCLDLFDMQSESLANRLKNINCKNIVLNLSGGLDSTMALLVCFNAFSMLGLDKSGMHIFTMPGFGTSSTTKSLAEKLCADLGLKLNSVDITDSCRAALISIGHDAKTADITFENVQARTRTMNALNLANQLNALMIGTGDLSEIALGFSTFGGDQIASYNINCCISKTVMRTMLGYVTDLDMFKCVKDTVNQVLNIPVSPELIPGDGKILQKTEDILAPYKLIDFFIYCTVVSKISPLETISAAKKTFGDEFSDEYINAKLRMFYQKFAVGQFKRSCSPECAIITHTALDNSKCSFASDGSIDIFYAE